MWAKGGTRDKGQPGGKAEAKKEVIHVSGQVGRPLCEGPKGWMLGEEIREEGVDGLEGQCWDNHWACTKWRKIQVRCPW